MIRRLVACLAIALLAVVAAAPAYADPELGFSTDGVMWTTTAPGPLFPAALRWSPGDTQQQSFYVRNQGPTDAQMTITAFTQDADKLVASGALVISVRMGSGLWTDLTAGRTRVQPALLQVARNATSRITVRVAMPASVTTQMDLTSAFRLRVVMFQGQVKGINTGHGGHGHGGGHVKGVNVGNGGNGSGLPNTGSPVTLAWIWIAAGLIGAGIALVAPRRRREADHG